MSLSHAAATASSRVDYSVEGGVAVLSVRHPPVNSLSSNEFTAIKAALACAQQDVAVKAVVIIGDGRTFPAGADIAEFPKLKQALIAGARVEPLAEVPQIVEDSSKLVVAAIHGTALGGGLELALGCHYRIALASARLGLPEVQLGLLPGAGGTQRLPRLIGVPTALQMISTGTPLPAAKALKVGLLDFVLPKERQTRAELLSAALVFARDTAAGGIDLDSRRLSKWPCLPEMPESVFTASRKMASRAARGYVAPLACIDAIEAAVRLPFNEGIAREWTLFQELLAGPQSGALQHVFFAQRSCSRVPGVPGRLARPLASIGIIGAGTMGGGVAMNFLQIGIPVILLETKKEYLERGVSLIRSNYEAAVKKRRLRPAQLEKYMSLLTPTLDYADLASVDLVIEAVFEDMSVKKQVLARLDNVCKPDAILCTNTSTLDVDEIASATRRPDKVVGTHFFSPANKMKLLENVRGKCSSDETIATVMAMGKAIHKVPVLVGNCFGFVGNRMIEWYGRESAYMVEEGASPQQIDAALVEFGMPMGPFAMADLAGNDITMKIRKSLGIYDVSTRPKAERYHGTLGDTLCAQERLGLKSGKGWYAYKKGSRRPLPDPAVDALIVAHRQYLGRKPRNITPQEMVERCILPLVNEGFKILEEGIAVRSSDIDIILVYGYGFPPYRGGPMYYGEQLGLAKIVAALDTYAQAHPDVSHWKVSPLLRRLASTGTTIDQYAKEQHASRSKL